MHDMDTFNNWIEQEKRDLDELVAAFSNNNNNSDDDDDEHLKQLVNKGIRHFEEYCKRRGEQITADDRRDATSLMCPLWCTSFENAFLWIGGCRPSLSIRLVYSVGGSQFDQHLNDQLFGQREDGVIVKKGNLAEISSHQINMINDLHCNTMKEEDKLSSKMATLQEKIADKPLAVIAKNAERVGEWNEEVERAMDAHSVSLAGIMAEADALRLRTFKKLMSILTPSQAVDFLIATKKLHLSIHEWGKTRDRLLALPNNNATTPA